MTEANPASIPEGLKVRLLRAEVLPGAEAQADRWMAMLYQRHDECVATLDRERMAVEIVFGLREGENDFLLWVTGKGADRAGLDEDDRDRAAQSRRTKEPGWTEAQPQVLLLPGPVQEAIMSWAVRENGDPPSR